MVVKIKNSAGIVKGVDFGVRLEPAMFIDPNGKKIEVPNRFVTVRNDTNQPLAVVGSEYHPQDHRDNLKQIADVLSNCYGDYTVRHNVVGARIHKSKNETAKVRIRVVNSYDGMASFKAFMDIWRQVCSNGMMGFADGGLSISKIHSKKLDLQQQLNVGIEDKVDAYISEYNEFYAKLVATKAINLKKLEADKDIPTKLLASAMDKYKSEKEQNAWGQFNSFTNIITHSPIKEERKEMLTTKVTGAFLRIA